VSFAEELILETTDPKIRLSGAGDEGQRDQAVLRFLARQ
jgi:hypothetical protein